MAIVKFGVTVVGIRGTVGGLVFSAGKSGPYVKTWSKSANPRTPKQSEQRAELGSIGEEWRALTQVNRDGWDTFAATGTCTELTNSLGELYRISGFLWFLKWAGWRHSVGASTRTAAGSCGLFKTMTLSSFSIGTTGTTLFGITPADFATEDSLHVWLTMSTSIGTNQPALMRRKLGFLVRGGSPFPTTVSFPDTDVQAIWGTPIANSRWRCECYIQAKAGARSLTPVTDTDDV